MAQIVSAAHLTDVISFDSLRKTINRMVRKLKPHRDKFDTIAFTGLSGYLIGPLLAVRLKKEVMAVRKGEYRHSPHKVEGNIGSSRYIIIDDFICSGSTLEKIVETITETTESYRMEIPQCVGIVLYRDSCGYTNNYLASLVKGKEDDIFLVSQT